MDARFAELQAGMASLRAELASLAAQSGAAPDRIVAALDLDTVRARLDVVHGDLGHLQRGLLSDEPRSLPQRVLALQQEITAQIGYGVSDMRGALERTRQREGAALAPGTGDVPVLLRQLHEVLAAQLHLMACAADPSRWKVTPGDAQPCATPEPFDTILDRAQRSFPEHFAEWRLGLGSGATPPAVSREQPFARAFRDFVIAHAAGRLLDLAARVATRPAHLDFYPAQSLSLIGPALGAAQGAAERVHGLPEYLPWPDRSFDTIVAAGSLHRRLSLAASLAEIRRVLRPEGRVLFWIGPHAAAPQDPDTAPDTTSLAELIETGFASAAGPIPPGHRVAFHHAAGSEIFLCVQPGAVT